MADCQKSPRSDRKYLPQMGMGCLLDALDALDALDRGYRVLGLDEAAGGNGVFRQLVLARIIEPASKIDSFEPTQAGNVGSAACAS